MSVPAQAAVFSFALQNQQMPENILLAVDQYDWFRTRAPRLGLMTVQEQENFPPETGGPIVPTGTYKAGQYGGGDVELIPRIENVLGVLLLAALGKVTSYVDQTYAQVFAGSGTTVGVNTHVFTFDDVSDYNIPWMAVRRKTPGRTVAQNYGEVFQDTRIGALRLDVRASGLLNMTVSFQSVKVFNPLASDVNAWAYANSTEDSKSAPLSNNNGRVLIDGVKYPITQISLDLNNGLTDARQERVVGNNHPDTYTPLSRQVSARFVVKWRDPDLYRQITNGGISSVEWDAIPFIADTVGNKEAFEATFYSPSNIGATSVPYMISIRAHRVALSLDRGGIDIQAGDIINVPYSLTFLEPDPGEPYVRIILQNAAAYTLPETPTITGMDTETDYDKSAAVPVPLTANATFNTDLAHINTGKMIVSIVDGFETGDVLDIEDLGTITVVGAEVQNSATAIGDKSGGTAGADLVVIFDTVNATEAAISALLEALSFNNAAATVGTFRTVRIVVWNGSGGFVTHDVEIEIVA